MSSQRRQNVPSNGQLPEDIDSLLERQIKNEMSRKEYQQRPEVQAKRKEYQNKQADQRKIARAAMKGDTATLVELGLTQEQAEAAVVKASEVMAAA